jgi:hypothetical protein
MLLKGSGEVLMAARLVALAAKLVAASVPPSSAATSAPRPLSAPKTAAASAAPAGMRITPCTTSHRIQAGDLVGKEFNEHHKAADAQHHRMRQHLQSGR